MKYSEIFPLIKKNVKSTEGAVLPLFAVTLFPILFLGGMVMDMGRQAYVNTQLAYACDAAAIAGARYNVDDVQTNALKIFYANYPPNKNNVSVTPLVTLSSDQTIVKVTASAQLSVLFSGLLGRSSLPVKGETQVRRQLASNQVAMVLDVTGSMAYNGKIDGLRVAATQLVNVIFENNTTLATTAISIIPFVATVNIGTQYKSWLSNPAKLSDFPTDDPWEGCVGVIDTGTTMDTDAPPSSSRKWPVYFAESTALMSGGKPTSANKDNDWYKNSQGKLQVLTKIFGINVGPNRSCGPSILPLTNQKSVLLDKIKNFTSANLGYGGGTFGNLGLVWGWNTISPKWAGLWQSTVQPTDYGAGNLKSLVIVTDGENNWNDESLSPIGDSTAYGFQNLANRASTNLLGTTSVSGARAKIDARVADLCTKIKAAGIQIFTVTFQVSNSNAKALYKTCATKPEWAFQAESSEDLYDQFSQIGNEIKKITIIK
jgi:Flp pilus assembly protein TadG